MKKRKPELRPEYKFKLRQRVFSIIAIIGLLGGMVSTLSSVAFVQAAPGDPMDVLEDASIVVRTTTSQYGTHEARWYMRAKIPENVGGYIVYVTPPGESQYYLYTYRQNGQISNDGNFVEIPIGLSASSVSYPPYPNMSLNDSEEGVYFEYSNGDSVKVAVAALAGWQASAYTSEGSYPTYAELVEQDINFKEITFTFTTEGQFASYADPYDPVENFTITQGAQSIGASWDPVPDGLNTSYMYYHLFLREQGESTWNSVASVWWNSQTPTSATIATTSCGYDTGMCFRSRDTSGGSNSTTLLIEGKSYQVVVVPESSYQRSEGYKSYDTLFPLYSDLNHDAETMTTFVFQQVEDEEEEEEEEDPGDNGGGNNNNGGNNNGGGGNNGGGNTNGNDTPTDNNSQKKTFSDNKPGVAATVQSKEVAVLSGERGAVTVMSGGKLQGTGKAASITVNSGATLAPGNSPGRLTVLTTLNLSGTYEAEVLNGSTYDSLRVGEDFSGNGSAVRLSGNPILDVTLYNGWSLKNGDKLTIIDNRSETTVQGTFANLAEGATISVGSMKFTISYKGGDGNDVVLTAITGGNDNDVSTVGDDESGVPNAPNTAFGPIIIKNPTLTLISTTVTVLSFAGLVQLARAKNG